MRYNSFESLNIDENISNRIIDAAIHNHLIIFMGAGIGCNYGLPSWNKLSSSYLDELLKLKIIDKSSLKAIKEKCEAIEIISFAHNELKKNKKIDVFNKLMKESLTVDPSKKKDFLEMENIFKGLSNKFVTTNADHFLDNIFPSSIYVTLKDFKKISSSSFKNGIIRIHGSVDNVGRIIFTKENYIKRYNNSSFINLLKSLFLDANNVFLFLGYSFKDIELLNFLSTFKKERRDLNNCFYFDICKRNEKDIFKIKENFLNEYNIKLFKCDYYCQYARFKKVLTLLNEEIINRKDEFDNKYSDTISLFSKGASDEC